MIPPYQPARCDLVANRWVPFDYTLVLYGADLTGASFQAQFRLYPDATGAPLIDLANAAPAAQGLSVSVATVDTIATSKIRICIDEVSLEQLLPFPSNGLEPGTSLDLAWDMLISRADLRKARWFEGTVTLRPGVTQA